MLSARGWEGALFPLECITRRALVQPVFRPFARVVIDSIPDILKIFFAANDVFKIISLPDAGHIQFMVCPAGDRGLEPCNE